MNWKTAFRRMLGGLFLYILGLPSVMFGYLLSPKVNIPSLGISDGLDVMLYILIRIVAFLLGLFIIYRLLRPYSKSSIFAIKPGHNLLFDEGPIFIGRFTTKLALSLICACVLFGFGVFGVFVLVAQLLFKS